MQMTFRANTCAQSRTKKKYTGKKREIQHVCNYWEPVGVHELHPTSTFLAPVQFPLVAGAAHSRARLAQVQIRLVRGGGA
jgi:hypothetical protein